jgi:tRNA(adenine34) deaminase
MARLAGERGEVPVGAVLVGEDGLLAEGHNRTISASDPTAHAEVEVVRSAAASRGDWRLERTTLFVTLEPCALCCGAILLARVPRVVFGAADPKGGMALSLGNLLQDPRLNHRVELTSDVLGEASARLLQAFFQARR